MAELRNLSAKNHEYSLLDSAEPLDADEQQRIVDELLAEAQRITSSGRSYFQWIYFGLGILFFTILGESFLRPFEMNHQMVFQNVVPHIFFQVYYICMCACFLLGGFVIHNGINSIPRSLKFLAFILCGCMFLGWAIIFIQYKVTELSLYWLPGVPVACVALAVYTDRDYEDLLKEVNRLNDLKYNYKKA